MVVLSSCSFSRKLNKQQHDTSSQTETSLDTKTHLQDKSTIKTTESIDTTATVPGQKITGQNSGTSTTVIVGQDTLKATYDAKLNVIKAQFIQSPKAVHLKGVKVVERNNDIVQDVVVSKDSTNKQKASDFSKISDVKTSNVWFWIILIGVILVVIFIAFKYFRKYIPFI